MNPRIYTVIFGFFLLLTQIRGDSAEYSSLDESPVQPLNFNQVRYDRDTQEIRTIGDDCGGNMRFFAQPDHDTLGSCDCDYLKCSRTFIYSPTTKECHPAWSKGPCLEGEWFVYDEKNKKPGCEAAFPCDVSDEDATQFFFKRPEDGMCYQSMSKGYCGRGETLMNFPGQTLPTCRMSTKCYPLSVPLMQICAPGNRRSLEGFCEY